MHNHKGIKETNGQRRSYVYKNDNEEESININVIGGTSSTITVLKRNEEERGKVYNVYEISVPSKSKPNVDTTKQVREVTPENYRRSLNKHRVPDLSRRLNAPPEDEIHKHEPSKKKVSFQNRDSEDTEFESDGTDSEDEDTDVEFYRLKRDYNTFAFPTLTQKRKPPVNNFSLSEDSPRSSLDDVSNTSSLDLKEPLLNKPKENKKVTFLTPHAHSENIKPINKPTIEKPSQVKPKYLIPETKMAPNLVIPTIIEPIENLQRSESFDNLSDIIKSIDNLENRSLDSEISSFHDIGLPFQLNKPKEKKGVSVVTNHNRPENEKLTQVGPVYLKPKSEITTDTLVPTIIEPRDNLSDITKWNYSYEDSSTDSDFFLSSDSSSQLNKPEDNVLTTRQYEHTRTNVDRKIVPDTLKSIKLKPIKLFPISESVDTLSDIPEWHDNFEDSSLESGKSPYLPFHNSSTHFPDILPEVNKLFAEPFGEKSTLAYSTDFNDDNEKTFDTTSVAKEHNSNISLDAFTQINSTSSLAEFEDKDNFDNVGQRPRKINKAIPSEKIINPPEKTEAPKTNDVTPSFKNDIQMKPQEEYFDEPYLQKIPSNKKSKENIDTVTCLDKYPSNPTFTDSERRFTDSETYFDKNIPYLEKTLGKKNSVDEINYISIQERPSDTTGQDIANPRTSYERYFDDHLPYLERRPKKLKLETEDVKTPLLETYFDQIFNPMNVKAKPMSTISDNFIDESFEDIKPEKIETENKIVRPASLKKSPDQISDPGSQQSKKSSTLSGRYFNKFVSYFSKKADKDETTSTDSKSTKGSSINSGKYFPRNIPYLIKRPNKEENILSSSGSSEGIKGSSTSSGKYSDEYKPLKKNTIIVSDEFQFMPYLEQSRNQFSNSESDDSKRSSNGERISQVEKDEPEYEVTSGKRKKDTNGHWIMMGGIDGTNPFGQKNTFDSDEVETTNYDSNFNSDTENHRPKRNTLKEDKHDHNVNDSNIYCEDGKRYSPINDAKRNGSDERNTNDSVPPYQKQEPPKRSTISFRPNSVPWNGEACTNDNNTLERTSTPRNSRFDQDLHIGDEHQVLSLITMDDNRAFVSGRNTDGSLENKPGKMSIVQGRDQAKRSVQSNRDNGVVSEGPTKYKETIPRRNTYNHEYQTPEYRVPQTERRSVNYPTCKDKNTMTDGSYNPNNNQDKLWFGTIKSQTYGPGDIDNTSMNDKPSLYKPRDSSIRPTERQSPRYSEVNDRRDPSIPGRKFTKHSEKRPSSVIYLPEKENIILDKKSPKSADDATPVTDKKKKKKKRFKSLHLPTSKPQETSDFGVYGTAVLSHKPIPPKEPPENLKKDLVCSLIIKRSKMDAICNLYFDPRLKELLLDQLGFIGGKIRRRRNKNKRKAGENISISESTSSTFGDT